MCRLLIKLNMQKENFDLNLQFSLNSIGRFDFDDHYQDKLFDVGTIKSYRENS